MNKFKDNLLFFRRQFKFTQKELAEKLNVSINNIGHWEKGRTEPNIDTIIALSQIFSITIDELITG